MTGAGVAVRETVPAFTLASGEAAERLLAVITRTNQYQVTRLGPESYRLTRRYRPMWSVLTLFLMRLSEVCDVTVGVDPATNRTVVHLSGHLPADTLHAVRLALGGAVPMVTAAPPAYTGPPMPAMSLPPQPPTAQSGPPPQYPPQQHQYPPPQHQYPPPQQYPPQQHPAQQFPSQQQAAQIYPPPQHPAQPNVYGTPANPFAVPQAGGYAAEPPTNGRAVAPQPGGYAATPSARLGPVVVELDDGQRASLGLLVLVGRNPAVSPDELAAQLVAVDDPGRSVSKTHLAIGSDEGGVWVVDRHSTNGVGVLGPAGPTRCAPGERVYLQLPATIRFGDRTLRVVAG